MSNDPTANQNQELADEQLAAASGGSGKPNVTVKDGENVTIKASDNLNLGTVTAEAGSTVTFG